MTTPQKLEIPYLPGRKLTFRNNTEKSLRVEVVTASGDVFQVVLGLGAEISCIPVGAPTLNLFDADPDYSGLAVISNDPE